RPHKFPAHIIKELVAYPEGLSLCDISSQSGRTVWQTFCGSSILKILYFGIIHLSQNDVLHHLGRQV
nr:hypothetical protein [Arenimonas sp.]